MEELKINESILYADDNFQVYTLRSAENFNLKQLESKKDVLTLLEVETTKPRIGIISGSSETNEFIGIVSMPVLLKDKQQIKVNIYNNSYFKGISIKYGDILGTITIG